MKKRLDIRNRKYVTNKQIQYTDSICQCFSAKYEIFKFIIRFKLIPVYIVRHFKMRYLNSEDPAIQDLQMSKFSKNLFLRYSSDRTFVAVQWIQSMVDEFSDDIFLE